MEVVHFHTIGAPKYRHPSTFVFQFQCIPIPMRSYSNVLKFQCFIFQCVPIPMRSYCNAFLFQCVPIPMCSYFNVFLFQYGPIPMCSYSNVFLFCQVVTRTAGLRRQPFIVTYPQPVLSVICVDRNTPVTPIRRLEYISHSYT